MKLSRVIEVVEKHGIVLVFPLDNAAEPPSLWHSLYPKSTMRWDWDANADPRVVELWHLREQLARSHRVAYGKWFRGRATFFSLPVFHALLATLSETGDVLRGLPREADEILDVLRERSPRSTKELRAAADLRGKALESVFQHAMKALWSRLLLVGIGEIADGAFPSLAVAATETMFEDLWLARLDAPAAARRKLDEVLAHHPAFARELTRSKTAVLSTNGSARASRRSNRGRSQAGPLEEDDELAGEVRPIGSTTETPPSKTPKAKPDANRVPSRRR